MTVYHFLYKTINLINNKYYIGVHSTDNLDDDYLGSGKLLKQAIKKYGRDNFTKEILMVFDSSEEMYKAEYLAINQNLVDDMNTYNLALGGKGGTAIYPNGVSPRLGLTGELCPMFGKSHSEETKRKISEAQQGEKGNNYGKPLSLEIREKISEKLAGANHPLYGSTMSDETKEKIRQSLLGTGKGEDNPMFKGVYITPYGSYNSASEAGKFLNLSESAIRSRCKYNNNKIIEINSKKVPVEWVGKSWKQLGWGFIPND